MFKLWKFDVLSFDKSTLLTDACIGLGFTIWELLLVMWRLVPFSFPLCHKATWTRGEEAKSINVNTQLVIVKNIVEVLVGATQDLIVGFCCF